MTTQPSALEQAILDNDVQAVAQCLDTKDKVGEPELMALVKLAWKNRDPGEDPEKVDAEEQAHQIYALIASSANVDMTMQTHRGRIVDRIAAARPDWPTEQDGLVIRPSVVRIEGITAEEREEEEDDMPAPRQSRGAMHRMR